MSSEEKFKRLFSFRNQLVISVILLSVLPLVILGLNALGMAGQSQKTISILKDRIIINQAGEIETYFQRLNSILSFTRSFETNINLENWQINSLLMNAIQSNREIAGLGFIRKGKLISYLGERMQHSEVEAKSLAMIKNHETDPRVQISDSYQISNRTHFELLYPLDTGDFLFCLFSIEELQEKLSSSSIGKTGRFSILSSSRKLFAGDAEMNRIFQFLEIEKVIDNLKPALMGTPIYDLNEKGYALKLRKLDELLWPMWLVFSQQENEANELSRKIQVRVIILLISIILIAGSISFALARNFSRPIGNLLEAVRKNREGESDVKAETDNRDKGELGLLIHSFNSMIENLKNTRAELVEKEQLAAIGEMANIIGHDIRNPLAAIKNGAYFIRHSQKEENKRVTMSLDIIDREIVSITNIIEDLLGFSRQRPPALEPVEVNALMDEVISIITLANNVSIVKQYDENAGIYNMDRGEMRQVLVNLINNAVQACVKKEKATVTCITSREASGNLKMVIKDTGSGIPKEDLEKIFKAFYSTKAGGTGLGMSSVKNIVTRHEGTINVRSEVGKGTEMIVTIPPLSGSSK